MPYCLQPPGHTPYPSKEIPVPPASHPDGVAADGGGEKEEKEEGREEKSDGGKLLAPPVPEAPFAQMRSCL